MWTHAGRQRTPSTLSENGPATPSYLILLLFLLETKQVKELENGNSAGGWGWGHQRAHLRRSLSP